MGIGPATLKNVTPSSVAGTWLMVAESCEWMLVP